jgi:DNA-binding response OmpR family regulator
MRILIIEDEKSIADFLQYSLETDCFVVDRAEDGETGSFLARTNEYDLIILDNVLPRKNGRDICQEIREKGKFVPILMLSAQMETDTKVELLNCGADDYLTKPFVLPELLARVRALLRRPKEVTSDVLRFEDVVFDTRKHTVRRGDKEIYLTRKELILLEYLMRNPGVALSRSMIMEHVWDMHADPFSNTVDSHIFSLRKKIETPGKKKLIYTIPGRGYRLGS